MPKLTVIAMGPKGKGKGMKKEEEEDDIMLEDMFGDEEDDFAEEDMPEEDMEELPEMDEESEDMGMSMVSEEELSIAKDLMSAAKDDDAEGFALLLKDFITCCK